MDSDTDTRLVAAWVFGVLGLLYSCFIDWDHIWHFLLQVPDPINLTGIQGRPFHTVAVVLLYAVVVAAGIVAFKTRRNDIE